MSQNLFSSPINTIKHHIKNTTKPLLILYKGLGPRRSNYHQLVLICKPKKFIMVSEHEHTLRNWTEMVQPIPDLYINLKPITNKRIDSNRLYIT